MVDLFKGLLPGLTSYSTARQNTTAAAASTPEASAPKASSAPTGPAASVFTGLCEALNSFQQQLVKDGVYEFADVYEIKFKPSAVMNLSVVPPGTTLKKATGMQKKSTNGKELLPSSNSVANNTFTVQVPFGKQIVQVIEETMRQSEFLVKQQNAIIDPVTGEVKPNASSANGQTTYFKISVEATPIGKKQDSKRKAYPYKITYVVTPYTISSAKSEWFPASTYRGVHKSFNYWFTGENTQILNYQQDYNYLYALTLSNQDSRVTTVGGSPVITDSRELTARAFATRSGETDSGNSANEPGANLAEQLYNTSDFSKISLQIVGDPAFLQQGEVTQGIASNSFNYLPFNTDGTINFDSGEILFDVSWNRPADYNSATGSGGLLAGSGLMDVTDKNITGADGRRLARENQTYRAATVRSTFSKGRFTQDLNGILLTDYTKESFQPGTPAPASTVAKESTPAPKIGSTPLQQAQQQLSFQALGNALGSVGGFLRNPFSSLGTDGRLNQPQSPTAPTSAPANTDQGGTTAPAANPKPPASNGDITPVTAPVSSTPLSEQILANQTARPLSVTLPNGQILSFGNQMSYQDYLSNPAKYGAVVQTTSINQISAPKDA